MASAVLSRLLATCVLLCAPLALPAELVWEKPLQEFHRAPEDLQLHASFAFRNAGAQPLEITRIATSCGCTAARLEQNLYAPGAAGHLDVDFTFGGRRGEQRKIITVTTGEGHQHALELRCFIDDALTLKPALVFWRLGEPPEPKTVELTVNGDAHLTVTEVKSPTPAFKVTLETVQPGKRYLVKVAPVGTAQKESAVLRIVTDFPSDVPKSYTVYARVK